jgi:hypothetical protein
MQTTEDNIFKINTNPVYCIDIAKHELFNFASFAVNDDELYKMMEEIKLALNATRPDYVNTIELSTPEYYDKWEQPKLYLSGKNMDSELIFKIIHVWKKMIETYNNEYMDKSTNTYLDDMEEFGSLADFDSYLKRDTVKEDFLKKVAGAYWLDLELGGSSGESRKVNKI